MAGPTAASVSLARKRFVQLNAQRLDRTAQMLQPKQRAFLDALPVLLHYNHPMLPGYTRAEVPAGISGYMPTANDLESVKHFSNDFIHSRKPIRQHDIISLFLMGSAGSIAFADDSDLDIWLCHRDGLDENELSLLQAKATAIEGWAHSLGLEAHFFLMNAQRFRAGEREGVTDEGSGSAQHFLLLDEFYRTSVWLAGRIPVWWFVPPESDGEYEGAVKKIRGQKFLNENDIIDFGGISRLPVQEFFGAAVWQVYKAIDSPYKSALKILLTESYAHDFPNTVLLSTELKINLYSGELSLEKTDPYLRLLHRLESYLEAKNDIDRLENARRYFYIKLDIPLSDKKKLTQWRTSIIQAIVKRWLWSDEQIVALDTRKQWKIDRIREEKNQLVKEISRSYGFLSDFARQPAVGATLNQQDLTVLGRKLYSAFERKAGKIELINLGIAPDPSESSLTLAHYAKENEERWLLFRGKVAISDFNKHKPLKTTPGIVEMITWCYFNGLIGQNTHFAVVSPQRERANVEIRSILNVFKELFPGAQPPAAGVRDFYSASRIVQSMMFVNIGHVPRALQLGLERQIVDQQQEVFHFGHNEENLVQCIDQIVVTSWREVFVFRHQGATGFMEGLCQYIQWSPLSSHNGPPPVKIHSFTPNVGQVIAQRVQQVWDEVIDVYFGPRGNPDARYVMQASNGFYAVYRDMNQLRYDFCDGYGKLLAFLERPLYAFGPLHIERFSLRRTVLHVIFRANKPGVIQTFIQKKPDRTVYYVIDENGALLAQETEEMAIDSLIHHLAVFFKSVSRRQAALPGADGPGQKPEHLEFYEVIANGANIYIERREIEYERVHTRFFNITVIGESVDEKPAFRIYCDGREFASIEYGEKLFESVGAHILEHRKSGANYPAYITDIDLAPALLGLERHRKIPTILYLNYKRRIEQRLDRALKNDTQKPPGIS